MEWSGVGGGMKGCRVCLSVIRPSVHRGQDAHACLATLPPPWPRLDRLVLLFLHHTRASPPFPPHPGDPHAGAETEGRHGRQDELAGAGACVFVRASILYPNPSTRAVIIRSPRLLLHPPPPPTPTQAIFVGVPLPGTGAWTGAALAALFKLSYAESLLGVVSGILSAGAIMTAVVLAGGFSFLLPSFFLGGGRVMCIVLFRSRSVGPISYRWLTFQCTRCIYHPRRDVGRRGGGRGAAGQSGAAAAGEAEGRHCWRQERVNG